MRGRAERKIDRADVVRRAVREDPLDPAHHRGQPAASHAVEYANVDDVSLWRDTDEFASGRRAVARDRPGDVGAVPARIRSDSAVREVDRRDHAVTEIRICRDARVEHGDRDASTGRPLCPELVGANDARVDRHRRGDSHRCRCRGGRGRRGR